MKRVRRWLFNLAAGVSLVLLVATAVLWVRSYWISDGLAYTYRSGVVGGQTVSGSLMIAASDIGQRATSLRHESWPVNFSVWDGRTSNTILNRVGFGYEFRTVVVNPAMLPPDFVYPPVVTSRRLIVPAWAILLVSTIVPARWMFLAHRVRRRGKLNLCVTCGYDLRVTPDRCPECGTVPEKVVAPGAANS